MTTVEKILKAPNPQEMVLELADGQTVRGILVEERVSRSEIPPGIHLYDIRHSDEDWCEPATIEHRVLVNWYGTLIVNRPIPFPNGINYLEISEYSLVD